MWRSQSLSTARAEDRRARFEQFARQHVDRSYRLAVALLADSSEAQDATHDALLRAWQHWPDLRDDARFDAWFQRILVNECRNRLRRRRRSLVRAIAVDEQMADPASVEAFVDREAMRDALGTLSPDHRVVLVLRFYLDLEVDEIAERTGTRLGTVKSRLHYGLRALGAAYAANNRTPEAGP